MKYILSVLLFVSIAAVGQDCKLNRETDPFTKEVKLSTGFIFVEGGSVTVDADSKEIVVLFPLKGLINVLIIIPPPA